MWQMQGRKEVEGSGNNEVNRTEQNCAHIYIYIYIQGVLCIVYIHRMDQSVEIEERQEGEKRQRQADDLPLGIMHGRAVEVEKSWRLSG